MPPHPTDEVNGNELTAPRVVTPGTAAMRSPALRKNSRAASELENRRPLAPSRMEMTFPGLKPGDTACSLIKLRMSNPAPISNINEKATSETTSRLRRRLRDEPKPPSPCGLRPPD